MEKILTVVIPSYNIEKYISFCLDSFLIPELEQYVEVLVIDDGSTDTTGKIAKSYQERYPLLFQYIYQENGGHGSTINTGIKHAKGKYFMVVDGDDWLIRNDLKVLVDKLIHLDVDLIVCHYARVCGKQETIVESKAPSYETIYDFENLEIEKYYFVLSSICYRTKLLQEMGLELPEHTYYVDLIYIIEPMLYVNKVVFLDIKPYQYRVGNQSQSIARCNMVKNYEQHKKVILRVLDYYKRCENDSKQVLYIKSIVEKALVDHYYILLQDETDIDKARQRLLIMDDVLRGIDKEFLDKLSKKILFLKLNRISKYQLLMLYRIFVTCKRLLFKENRGV